MNKEFKYLKGRTILYLFPEQDRFMDKWQRWHFIDELEGYGVNFEFVNPIKEEQRDYENIIFEKIRTEREKYSLFMTAMNDYELSTSFIISLKGLGVPTLLICWDNLSIPFFHKRIASAFDLVWLTSFETEKLFQKWGANTVFLPYAANPKIYKPTTGNSVRRVAFIGSPYGIRGKKISKLFSNKIPVDVYGNWSASLKPTNDNSYARQVRKLHNYLRFDIGRKCLHGFVKKKISCSKNNNFDLKIKSQFLHFKGAPDIAQMVQIYSNYSLSLGVTELLDTYLLKSPLHKIHLRTFEIPMSGGVQITSRLKELENYFEDGKEILFYDNEDHLVELSKKFLFNKESRFVSQIKKNAFKRALNEHTWFNRFKHIEDKLFQ